MLFLKYLDDLEQERAMVAELKGKSYEFLIEYINDDLFPYLQGFKEKADGPDTIEYKIGAIFGEIKSKFQSGYSLRDALDEWVRSSGVADKPEMDEQ